MADLIFVHIDASARPLQNNETNEPKKCNQLNDDSLGIYGRVWKKNKSNNNNNKKKMNQESAPRRQ